MLWVSYRRIANKESASYTVSSAAKKAALTELL